MTKSTKFEVIDGTVNEEDVVEVQPTSRIAKLKSIAKDPMFAVAAVGAVALGIIVVVANRTPDPDQNITPEMIAEDEAIAI